jgi:hypothetical protein
MVDGNTETYTVTGPDGDTDELHLPAGLVDVLSEQGETASSVVTEVTLQAFVQQVHAIVHHSEGEVPPDLLEMNETAEALFEDRFGVPVEEAFGHSH